MVKRPTDQGHFSSQSRRVSRARFSDFLWLCAFAQTEEEIRSIADQEANYVLSAMERLKGKAILVPEVIALVGVMRYAESTDNLKLLGRVDELYRAAYLTDDSLLKDCWSIVRKEKN